ncbi:hypothetical protein FACS189413_01780 [Bacteroidia bacterium]|nr:hypothetical protein FACS189413_01780 [Bacteroidia bacterium]
MKKKFLNVLLFSFAVILSATANNDQVKISEGTLDLPTYQMNAAETAPFFERDYSYQRARRSVYPYPMNDNMTRKRENVTYKALYLENEYVKLCVLPEIGGRLWYAIDKTNGYDIVYRNDVIKPANVGMLGAWVSGGAEWNVFHHHRATTHTPSDYKLEESADGSKTIWVGETELRHRMSWAIGITLHPGKSYIEISGRLINSTENSNSMLYWSNVATHVDENYQILFPQSTEFGTYHSKESFCHWPITHEAYRGDETYSKSVDASWWKNHPTSNSIFVYDQKENYIGGYDYGRHAGTMLVGNHNIVKGGKFWLWGPNSEWDTKILTDAAGHYCELMQGAYSDNQPDYNWTSPYEIKQFSQYWYGIRNIEGVKAGCREAAINLNRVGKGKVLLGVNATEKLSNMTVVLKTGDQVIFSETTDIAPDAPFVKTVPVDKNIREKDLRMTLIDATGKEILAYIPVEKDMTKPLPEIVDYPLLPKQIESTEECYYTGLRNLQFANPFINPTDYFMEVIRRDPGDTRANTQMGIWYRLRGENEKAKMHLRTAIKRQTKDYTRPKECEAMYNLGLILKSEGRFEAAIDTLYRAVWSYEFNSAANYQLAQLYASVRDYNSALERLNEAIVYNGNNFNALNLKATILRHQGKNPEAFDCINRVLEVNPINTYATREKSILTGDNSFTTLMRDIPESYLELAIGYWHNGFTEEAVEILKNLDARIAYPTIRMYLAFFADKAGDKVEAKKQYEAALALPTDYCNMFRLETIGVLENAKEYYPGNDKIQYYLGNIFYDKQPDVAMTHWQKCVEINSANALAWRNLGWGYWMHNHDLNKSAGCYRKAIELAPEQALFLEEIDQVYEQKGEEVKVRYDLLKSHHETCVKRYYPLAAEVITGTFMGDYDYVLDLLTTCYFPTREGVANFHDVYVDALMMAAQDKAAKGKYEEAIALYEKCFEYPVNHQVFLVDTRVPRDAQTNYFIGEIYDKTGNKSKATLHYKKSAAVDVKNTDYRFWQALSLQKLGKTEEAKPVFENLIETGRNGIVESIVNFFGAEGNTGQTVETVNTKAYYTIGLGQLGLNKKSEANKSFKKAVELKRDNLWANFMEAQTK